MPCVWLPNGVILNVREEAFKSKSFMKFLDRVRKKAQKGCGTTWPEMAHILESCAESPNAKIQLIEDIDPLNDGEAIEKNPLRDKTESADRKYPPKEKPKKPKPHLKVVK